MDDAKTPLETCVRISRKDRWEPDDVQPSLLRDEPSATGDERWDALPAALAEHLAAQHDLATPEWTEIRVLQWPWSPRNWNFSEPTRWYGHRRHFRKHGVYLSVRDLEAA